MIATAIGEKRQTTLPLEICEALNLNPGDRLGWDIQDGKLVGQKLVPETVKVYGLEDVDPVTFLPKDGAFDEVTVESINAAIRADRDR